MLEVKKYAAIDIGSNAMRLLITMVMNDGMDTEFKKVSLIRLPIRLGQEAFTDKMLSSETINTFIEGMRAFKIIMEIHRVKSYMAVGTSAMRESNNRDEVVKKIKAATGLNLEIIEPKTEAQIIFKAHFRNNTTVKSNYIYVDVGGGSTEVTILNNQKVVASRSFKIGTIRMINNMVSNKLWDEMKTWIKLQTIGLITIEMIGSGGNINKIHKLLAINYNIGITYPQMKIIKNKLRKMDFNQRMRTYKLNPDRADVIVPAAKIYSGIMKWTNSSIMHVPK